MTQSFDKKPFQERRDNTENPPKPYAFDKGRILQSASFRRLQAKTQVMGVGEGDFHRTRLTHSIEVAQIGERLVAKLKRTVENKDVKNWLPPKDLIAAVCYAHDLGHPPYGHAGEKALHAQLPWPNGFEGNGQSLRIITRLEKNRLVDETQFGLNPTRRVVLGILKYPRAMDQFENLEGKPPPKCFHVEENDIVEWATEPFDQAERGIFSELGSDQREGEHPKPMHRTLDCSIMDCADEIAYGVHDLEDIVGRHLVVKKQVLDRLNDSLENCHAVNFLNSKSVKKVVKDLFDTPFKRKETIEKLLSFFVSAVECEKKGQFQHPLLGYRAVLEPAAKKKLDALAILTSELIVRSAETAQLERKGERVVCEVFDALNNDPGRLIPQWRYRDANAIQERKVADYVAGMTDPFINRIHRRLFEPGFGSSSDEL